ncbi:hypothetical protein O3P69_000591 [Scylla paramamosain]|uniref:Uncharacterized protein n=1 Tax=Scylla paramamosain TaxID=85552 RepID=A0AAW0UQH0_SCYPA
MGGRRGGEKREVVRICAVSVRHGVVRTGARPSILHPSALCCESRSSTSSSSLSDDSTTSHTKAGIMEDPHNEHHEGDDSRRRVATVAVLRWKRNRSTQ